MVTERIYGKSLSLTACQSKSHANQKDRGREQHRDSGRFRNAGNKVAGKRHRTGGASSLGRRVTGPVQDHRACQGDGESYDATRRDVLCDWSIWAKGRLTGKGQAADSLRLRKRARQDAACTSGAAGRYSECECSTVQIRE